MFIIIIQARMGSTRLPGKIMKKILDKEIILWSYDRSKKSKADDIFIATSINIENDILEEFLNEKKIKYYRGSETDLLDRYYKLLIVNNLNLNETKIIRITSDCPFVDTEMINNMIEFYNNNNFDYITNENNVINPEGSGIEIINFKSLEFLWNNENDMKFREHVCGYLINNTKYDNFIKKGIYIYNPLELNKNLIANEKISIDTIIEYSKAIKIAKKFNTYDFTYTELLKYLQNTKTIKNKYGYYELINKNINDANFYNNYYTNLEKHTVQYKKSYTEEELLFFENSSKKIYEIVKGVINKKILDIGCGEGFNSKFFLDKNFDVKCVDLDDNGILNNNPILIDFFIKSDIIEYLEKLVDTNEKFGIIIVNEVLEYLKDPKLFLELINKIMDKDSILVITVPNDFNDLTNQLIENKLLNDIYCISEHINYFTKDTLFNLTNDCKFNVHYYYATYPIEFDLLIENTNYLNNVDVGKYGNNKRLKVDNFLCSQSIKNTIEYYNKLANLNVGRHIVGFFKIK